jgi:hypothetical protein
MLRLKPEIIGVRLFDFDRELLCGYLVWGSFRLGEKRDIANVCLFFFH